MTSRHRQKPVHKRFQIARKSADTRLNRLDNVVGTGIGARERKASTTREKCLIVFVRKKRSERALRHNLIPKRVIRHGRELPTDVIEIRGLENQLRFGIQDGRKAGTMGCFGRKRQNLFGVTCAHCLGGPDANTSTPDDVVVEYPNAGDARFLGRTADAVDFSGMGIYPSYGALDSGLVLVTDLKVQAYATRQAPLRPLRFDSAATPEQISNLLVGMKVTGWGATSGVHQAIISAVFLNVFGQFFDVMVTDGNNGPLTEKGDSGLVWINQANQAVAFHMQGNAMPNNAPSTRGFGVLAFRVADQFGVTFVEA